MKAMRLSMSTVNEKGFLMHFVFVLLIYVIPLIIIEFLTAMLPFSQLLKIFLPPLQVGCLSGLYIDQFEEFKESVDELNEASEESTPATRQQPEETGVQVKEESKQSEQPVSGQAENSDQAAPESFPEENVQDEKPKEANAPHNQTKKNWEHIEDEPRYAELPVSEEATSHDQVKETEYKKPDTD